MWSRDENQVKIWCVVPPKAGGPKSKPSDLLQEQVPNLCINKFDRTVYSRFAPTGFEAWVLLGTGVKRIAFKNYPPLNNACLRNCVFIFKVTSLLPDYFFLLTVNQSAYLPYFHNESFQARDAVADLQPASSRTDRHFNMKGDMMSLMYSDVTSNKVEACFLHCNHHKKWNLPASGGTF